MAAHPDRRLIGNKASSGFDHPALSATHFTPMGAQTYRIYNGSIFQPQKL
jgi:hypothetical protein